MGRTEVETLFRRVLAFVQRCRDGLRQEVDESDDVYDMCLGVEKKLPEVSRLRLFLLTNSITSVTALPGTMLRRSSGQLRDLGSCQVPPDGDLRHAQRADRRRVRRSAALPGHSRHGSRLLRLPGHPARHDARRALRPVRHSAAGTERPVLPPGQGRSQPRHPRHAAHRPGTVPRLQQRHHRDRLARRVRHASRRRPGPSAASTTCRSSTGARPPRPSTTPMSRTRPISPASSSR